MTAMNRALTVALLLCWVQLIFAKEGLSDCTKYTAKQAVEKELKELQGVWYHVSRFERGKEAAGEDKEDLFVVRGDVCVLKRAGHISQVGRLKLVDPGANPKKIDIVITDGANEGVTVHAIYELEKDTFRYCASIRNRPTSFATEQNVGSYCSTYKRLKPKK